MKKDFYDTPEKLAAEPSFRNWVLNPSAEDSLFWETWLRDHPEYSDIVAQARVLVLALERNFGAYLPERKVNENIGRITRLAADRHRPLWTLWTKAGLGWSAAAVLLALAAALAVYRLQTTDHTLGIRTAATKKRTDHPAPRRIQQLWDGSVAILEEGSRLHFLPDTPGAERTALLEGEAYFEVVRDEKRPFRVFAGGMVTKVLGTSFNVRAIPGSQTAEISVVSGKVAVFKRDTYEKHRSASRAEPSGIILTRRQYAVLREDTGELKAVRAPGVSPDPKAAAQPMVFENAPVARILRSVEEEYGIPITFDEAGLHNCRIDTEFGEESLLERLGIICKALGTTYSIQEGKIIIVGAGCGVY